MARTVRANRPFKLDGSRNTRDIGGYPTKYGINTANGQFVRSDNPGKFTADDLQRLYDYGVRLQIDFRSTSETVEHPSKLMGYKDIEFLNPQLLDDVHSSQGISKLPALGDMYCGFLDNARPKYLPVFKNIIEKHMDDCVFWNCSAGKDRAGTFAMILLKLAGCSDEVVVIDYEPSGANIAPDMKAALDGFAAKGVTITDELRDMVVSRPIHAEKAMAHLRHTYGTIEDWMLKVGLTVAEIDKLRSKVLGQY